MSTSIGNTTRKRPQKHQNRTAFKNNLHDTSQKTKFLNSLQISGVCKRCKDKIDWKIKYKKYKPLSAPSKCVSCEEKTVKYAYHVLCRKCASAKKVCAKCSKPVDEEEQEEEAPNTDVQAMLQGLPERKRRTILRLINKQGGDGKLTSEMKSNIEDLLSKMDINDDFDKFSSDDTNKDSDVEG